MNKTNNIYAIEGVLYGKNVRKANGKKGTKNEGTVYEFPSIILEVKRTYKGTEYVELPEFELGKGVNIEDFAIKDNIEITFSTCGKDISFSGDDGAKKTLHKTFLRALYIKHTDIQGDDTRDVGGKTPREENKKEDAFTSSLPYSDASDDESDGLPF